MRILQVNKFNYVRGGAEKYFIEISHKLKEAGHEVAIFSMHHPKNLPSSWDKYFVSRISFEKTTFRNIFLAPFRILYSFEAKRKFKKIVKDFKPDIIHIHNIYHQISPSILPIAKKFKIPVVMHLHDYKLICPNYQLFVDGKICTRCRGQKYYNCLKHKCFKKSFWQSFLATIEMYFHHKILNIYLNNINYFIAPSNFMKKTVIDFGVSENKVGVVYNFIDDIKKNDDMNTTEDDYVLYFGRLSTEKGIDVLLRALSITDKKIKAKIVGSGPEELKLKNISQELFLEGRVEFLGYKSGIELNQIVNKAKAIIIPSIWAENMPFSLLESLSVGKIVIASRVGGMVELIEDEKSGFLFENGNYHQLAEKIDNLNKYDLLSIKKMAQKRVFDLNVNNHLKNILDIYKKYV